MIPSRLFASWILILNGTHVQSPACENQWNLAKLVSRKIVWAAVYKNIKMTEAERERSEKKKLLGFDAQARQGLLQWKEDELLEAAQQMSWREYWQFGARLRRVKSRLWARSLCLGDWELVAVGKVDKEKEWVLFWRYNIQNRNVFMQLWKAGLQRLKGAVPYRQKGKERRLELPLDS